ncbi:MAG: diguanylate cyclase [Candidatus Melainabacteria bacterium]|nr:diguanylate cyclase [Candidatus Melainabacteria bacterium]
MPLFDSLSTSQVHRLPKMNSVPTTDDLRYAIAEGQKRIGKTIELPFEHPNNHQFFVVKLNLSVGNKNPPSWSLQRGDGPNAIRLWNRGSEDVLMVQNKIKIDAQYVPQEGEEQVLVPSQPMSLQVNIGSGGLDMDNPLAPGVAGASADPSAPAAPQSNFYAQANQNAINAFQAPPQIAPAPSDNWVDGLIQPPVFNPGASKTNMPALHVGTAQPVAGTPRPAAPLPLDQVPGHDQSVPDQQAPHQQAAGQPSAPAPSAPGVALPPPIKLDVTLIDKIGAGMIDPATGMHSFAAFVYYLFREQAMFRRSNTPYAVVVFEVALRIGNENVALPGIALPAIIDRVNTVVTEFDIVTHLSGGEFAALLPGMGSEAITEWAKNLHSAVTSEPLTAGNRSEGVLAAIGMATLPQTCDDPEVLIAAARQAKETAKTLVNPILLFPS